MMFYGRWDFLSFFRYVTIPILVLIFILTLIIKNTLTKRQVKLLVSITLLCSLFITGSDFFNQSIIMEDEIKTTNVYNFGIEFSVNETFPIVEKFLMYYNLEKNFGNMSFDIDQGGISEIKNVRILLPSKSSVKNVKLRKEHENNYFLEDENYTTEYSCSNSSIYQCYLDINISGIKEVDQDINFFINFTSEIKLKPKIKFKVNSKKFISRSQRNIILDMGKKYRCDNPCYGEVINSILDVAGTYISVKYPDNYYENVENVITLRQEFTLNLVDKKFNRDMLYKRNLGIAILGGSVIFLIEITVTFFLLVFDRKYKCRNCGKEFDSELGLRNHINSLHRGRVTKL